MLLRRTCFIVLSVAFILLLVIRNNDMNKDKTSLSRASPDLMLTVRVNTYRRLDLLREFLDSYHKCDVVKQIQVIWSDQENDAPIHWLKNYEDDKILFEIHQNNSLNNRFFPLQTIPTEAVLSVDDDLVIPCLTLSSSVRVWSSNPATIVGFSPRIAALDPLTGKSRYMRWQHTWWNGIYSIVLTKACILHQKYLTSYRQSLPTSIASHIDRHRNCEDVAMAHIVASESHIAPVWIDGTIFEIGNNGISSGKTHFQDRGECLTMLYRATNCWPWVTGFQKSVVISHFDILNLWWFDSKL